MKRLALTAALILSAAAPALAQSQLEQSVGAPAGKFTLAELVELKAAAEQTGNDAIVHFGSGDAMTVSTSGPVNDRAAEIFRGLAQASDDSIDRVTAGNPGTPTGMIVNDRARAIVEALIEAGDEGGNG